MINVGIDVHKKTCVAAVKDDSGKLLERSKFENSVSATTNFATDLKAQYPGQLSIMAVCESTVTQRKYEDASHSNIVLIRNITLARVRGRIRYDFIWEISTMALLT